MTDLFAPEPQLKSQRVPEDGVYVTYSWNMGHRFHAAHKSLTNAVAEASDIYDVGFARWDTEGIEPIQAEQNNDH